MVYSKSSWQTGSGVPADGKRDVPDVSLTAAVHDGYLVYINGALMLLGGTSAASPALAGIMALIVQSTAAPQGNANPVFYTLAARQNSGGPAVFHDTVSGNNSVPGLNGFNAVGGYDQATGLGSVDANMLVTHWSDGSAPSPPSFQLIAPAAVSLAAANSASLNISVTVANGINAPVGLSVAGLPAGVSASFSSNPLSAPGSAVLNFAATLNVRCGTYPLTVTAASGAASKIASVGLVVTIPATFTLATSAGSAGILPDKRTTVLVSTTISSTFNSLVSFSVSGARTGLVASFSPASIKSPGAGRITLTISTTSALPPGSYTLTIHASGGGVTRAATIVVNVPGFTLAVSPTSISLAPGGKGRVTVTTAGVAGFNSLVSFSVSRLPAGITGSWTATRVAAPGSGTVTLNLARGSNAKVANYTITITAAGGNNQTAAF